MMGEDNTTYEQPPHLMKDQRNDDLSVDEALSTGSLGGNEREDLDLENGNADNGKAGERALDDDASSLGVGSYQEKTQKQPKARPQASKEKDLLDLKASDTSGTTLQTSSRSSSANSGDPIMKKDVVFGGDVDVRKDGAKGNAAQMMEQYDDPSPPPPPSFLKRNWKCMALSALLIVAIVLGGMALLQTFGKDQNSNPESNSVQNAPTTTSDSSGTAVDVPVNTDIASDEEVDLTDEEEMDAEFDMGDEDESSTTPVEETGNGNDSDGADAGDNTVDGNTPAQDGAEQEQDAVDNSANDGETDATTADTETATSDNGVAPEESVVVGDTDVVVDGTADTVTNIAEEEAVGGTADPTTTDVDSTEDDGAVDGATDVNVDGTSGTAANGDVVDGTVDPETTDTVADGDVVDGTADPATTGTVADGDAADGPNDPTTGTVTNVDADGEGATDEIIDDTVDPATDATTEDGVQDGATDVVVDGTVDTATTGDGDVVDGVDDGLTDTPQDQAGVDVGGDDALSGLTDKEKVTAGSIRSNVVTALTGNAAAIAALDDLNTPQGKALQWMSRSEQLPFSLSDEEVEDGKVMQRYPLAAVYFSLGGSAPAGLTDNTQPTDDTQPPAWLSANDHCDWGGLECTDDGEVSSIDLSNMELSGEIPAEISMFSNLVTLDLMENGIGGAIPEELFSLGSLENLYLNENNIQGGLSTAVAQLTQLKTLRAGGNKMEGTLPAEVGNLKFLRFLDVSRNNFNDQVPATLGTMNRLFYLDLSDNVFSGPLPSLGQTNRILRMLYLESNSFEGTIPESYGSLGENRGPYVIDLSDNLLTGPVPAFEGYDMLATLKLENNQLEGTMPDSICDLSIFEGGQDDDGTLLKGSELVELEAECTVCTCETLCKKCQVDA